MKKLFKIPDFLPLVLVLFFAVLAGRTLIFQNGYFNMHDDLQMMRQFEMEKCFLDGQIPCRWVPDMGYGYGFPLFNFYPPLPYLFGEVFRIFHFSFVDTAQLTFAVSFIFSGITMYFLAKEFFGRWGGVISAIFYIWAPYHSVDIYVRGAMNEAWAFIWFPLILWTSYRLIQEKKQILLWVVSLSFAWTGLLLSHNLMVMIFTPVFASWCLIFWLKKREIKKIVQLAVSGLMSLILASFFTLPAIFEQKYVHVDTLTQGYYEYIAHFATIRQLLTSRFWGYGPSVWGINDGMPFQVGHVHWILSFALILLAGYYFWKKRKINSVLIVSSFGFAFAWFATFMAHQNSTFIWQNIKPLSFVQFPWRFLTLGTLGFSFIAGSLWVFLEKFKFRNILISALVLFLVVFNWKYFLPQNGHMGPLTDQEKFSGAAWDLQRTAGIFDYLPKTAKENPKEPPRILVNIMDGEGTINSSIQGTNWLKAELNLVTDSTIRVNIFDFPVWRTKIDGQSTKIYIPDSEKWGRIYIDVSKGKHTVYMRLQNTAIRNFANVVSIFGWLILLPLFFFKKKILNEKLA